MPSDIIRFDINLFAIFLLVMMFAIQKLKGDAFSYSSHLLRVIIIVNIFVLIIEPVTWIFDNKTFAGARFINYSSNFLLVLIAPMLIGMWAAYIDYKVFGIKKRLYKLHFYQFPTYVMFVLLIVNFFYPIFFSISPDNHYKEEGLFWIKLALVYLVYIYWLVVLIIKHKQINSKTLIGIAAFFFLPAIGSILQIVEVEFFFTWTMLALSVVVVYIFLETTSGNLDYLTNLYSRRSLEEYLTHLQENKTEFTCIMIDLDHFKEINDNFGHHQGDLVLIEFGLLLKKFFAEKAFISRLGGDEFFIVFKKKEYFDYSLALNDVYSSLTSNKLTKNYPFFSFSYGVVECDENLSLDEIFHISDKRMYENKVETKTNGLKSGNPATESGKGNV